ncbi:MAG: ATP-binding protein [Prevotella sp.]
MTLKPWREIAIPHEDVLKGTFVQAEFAADLTQVKNGVATAEYQKADLFFRRTYITEGMKLLLGSVIKRLLGQGGDPVIQLQTSFGGGKTHSMLSVYHLATTRDNISALSGVGAILEELKIFELPKAHVAVLDGNALSPDTPMQRGNVMINTLWGEMAYQIGGEDAFAMVAQSDASGVSPGKEILSDMLNRFSPCIILIDELVAYIRQFEEGKSLTGGTFDSNLSFVQALTEALKTAPKAMLLASLPESEKEAGSSRGVRALETLSHYFGRVQALWKPVAPQEAFEIVRRRLFDEVTDIRGKEAVCRTFVEYYVANSNDFPAKTQESRYLESLINSYPIHPELFSDLYDVWATLENFQRTRGVLKLMAKVIHRLWTDGSTDPMIMPGSLPLYDRDVAGELLYYLPQGWQSVVDRDIDGENAETLEIERNEPRFGTSQTCRRLARAIFAATGPATSSHMGQGSDEKDLLLGALIPGHTTSLAMDALKRLADRAHHLSVANGRYWFDTRPNLRREMEDRKKRFNEKEHLAPKIRNLLNTQLSNGSFSSIHIFADSSDIPDDWGLKLVVLPLNTPHSRTGYSRAKEVAENILRFRGEQPRQKQNRLIFLALDHDTSSRLNDQARSWMAWSSIVDDAENMRINLEILQVKQAKTSRDDALETLKRVVKDAFKWIIVPSQVANVGGGISATNWESFQLVGASMHMSALIEQILIDNEVLISRWSPIHLHKILKEWYWKIEMPYVSASKVWKDCCSYLYLPRFKNEDVFHETVIAGTDHRDFYGYAYGEKDGKYIGFQYGRQSSSIYDETFLLIEPNEAARYADVLKSNLEANISPEKADKTQFENADLLKQRNDGVSSIAIEKQIESTAKGANRFYGSVKLDSRSIKLNFNDIYDELIKHLAEKEGITITIRLDVEATVKEGRKIDDSTIRTIKENAKSLKFDTAEFE